MEQKKIAIFVEGQTERIFVEKLLYEIAGYNQISIEIYKMGGSKRNRIPKTIKTKIVKDSYLFVLLYDCSNESHVVSDIIKQYLSLRDNGYQKIIGLRDLYPKPLEQKQNLEKSLRGAINSFLKMSNPDRTTRIPIRVILAVMEIEAWFLAEWSFLSRIDNRLTSDYILKNCGFDLRTIDIEQIRHPSQDLDNIYQLIDCAYGKSLDVTEEIVKCLNYELIYLELVNNVEQLKKFIDEIDDFMSHT